jgi:hypothetical protein
VTMDGWSAPAPALTSATNSNDGGALREGGIGQEDAVLRG